MGTSQRLSIAAGYPLEASQQTTTTTATTMSSATSNNSASAASKTTAMTKIQTPSCEYLILAKQNNNNHMMMNTTNNDSCHSLPTIISSTNIPVNFRSDKQAFRNKRFNASTNYATSQNANAPSNNAYRGHHRRQSVARLLPDISKLRLLSWLVEASSELLNCDIAIMDGVYAKLNKSQESLLFWNSSAVANSQVMTNHTSNSMLSQPPPPPTVQPAANKIVISQKKKQLEQQQAAQAARNHHSLPLVVANDATSLGGVSLSQQSAAASSHKGFFRHSATDTALATRRSIISGGSATNSASIVDGAPAACNKLHQAGRSVKSSSSPPSSNGHQRRQTSQQNKQRCRKSSATTTSPANDDDEEEDQEDADNSSNIPSSHLPPAQVNLFEEADGDDEEEDDASSASSAATSSSGIHGGETSISSRASSTSDADVLLVDTNSSAGSVSNCSTSPPSSVSGSFVDNSSSLLMANNNNSASVSSSAAAVAAVFGGKPVNLMANNNSTNSNRHTLPISRPTTFGSNFALSTNDRQQQQQEQQQQQQQQQQHQHQQKQHHRFFGLSKSAVSTPTSTAPSSATQPATCAPTSHSATASLPNRQLYLSPAEKISEKIRQTVMKNNYLQSLLVNIIRQHDFQRDLFNQQQQHQLNRSQTHQQQHNHRQRNSEPITSSSGRLNDPILSSPTIANNNVYPYFDSRSAGYNCNNNLRIDLAEICESLDDGCLCACHSRRLPPAPATSSLQQVAAVADDSKTKASTLPTVANKGSNNKSGTGKKFRRQKSKQQSSSSNVAATAAATTSSTTGSATNDGLNSFANDRDDHLIIDELEKQDLISQMSDKLCENCFETHYWLQSCWLDHFFTPSSLLTLSNSKGGKSNSKTSDNSASALNNDLDDCSSISSSPTPSAQQIQELNATIARRNANFIKLVQQEVRATINKSIELIDLIRREIKSPEYIKQKQLMKSFSKSIQLLTSVGRYVVPNQDMSSLIPPNMGQSPVLSSSSSNQNSKTFAINSSDSAYRFNQHRDQHSGQSQTGLFSLPSSDFDHLMLFPAAACSPLSLDNQINANYHLPPAPEIPIRRKYASIQKQMLSNQSESKNLTSSSDSSPNQRQSTMATSDADMTGKKKAFSNQNQCPSLDRGLSILKGSYNNTSKMAGSSLGVSSNSSSASSSMARGSVQQSSLSRAHTSNAILDGKVRHDLSFEAIASSLSRQQPEDDMASQSRLKFWQSPRFKFIKKLLHVKEERLLRQQSKDRRIYNNKVQNKIRLVMRDLTHFNKSQQLLTTENGVNSLLTSMRNVLEFGTYLTLKLY